MRPNGIRATSFRPCPLKHARGVLAWPAINLAVSLLASKSFPSVSMSLIRTVKPPLLWIHPCRPPHTSPTRPDLNPRPPKPLSAKNLRKGRKYRRKKKMERQRKSDSDSSSTVSSPMTPSAAYCKEWIFSVEPSDVREADSVLEQTPVAITLSSPTKKRGPSWQKIWQSLMSRVVAKAKTEPGSDKPVEIVINHSAGKSASRHRSSLSTIREYEAGPSGVKTDQQSSASRLSSAPLPSPSISISLTCSSARSSCASGSGSTNQDEVCPSNVSGSAVSI